MTESLNVNKNNLNNKRLSRLQGVILKVLATSYPLGCPKRNLSQIVARLYGKGSVITPAQKESELEKMPLGIDQIEEKLQSLRSIIGSIGAGREGWLNPKFSVSYSRSIRDLLSQGLVTYSPAIGSDGNSSWAVFITNKGLAKIQDRKVKVNAKFWDFLLASLNDKQRGADSQS